MVFLLNKQSEFNNKVYSDSTKSKPLLQFLTKPKFCSFVTTSNLLPYLSSKFFNKFCVSSFELSFIIMTLFKISSGVFLKTAYAHNFTHSGALYTGIITSHLFCIIVYTSSAKLRSSRLKIK